MSPDPRESIALLCPLGVEGLKHPSLSSTRRLGFGSRGRLAKRGIQRDLNGRPSVNI